MDKPLELSGLLLNLQQRLQTHFDRVAEAHGVSTQQAFALLTLSPSEPMPMNKLAEVMACHASNITGIVDRLEARGVLERTPGSDRRVKLLALTRAGAALRADLNKRLFDDTHPIASLPPADQDKLRRLLLKAVGTVKTPAAP